MRKIKGIYIGVYSFVSLLGCIVMMGLFRNKTHIVRRMWASSMIKMIGVDIKEIGKLDTNADMLIINHNSMLDIMMLDYLHPKDIAWVARASLAQTPVFGQIFKLPKLILIDQKSKHSLKKLSIMAKEEYDKDRPIAIFPEGTRGDDDDLQKFQIGAKILAQSLNLRVQPIVLTHTRDRLNTSNMTSSSGEVKVIYLDTITTEEKDWYKNVEAKVKEIYYQNI